MRPQQETETVWLVGPSETASVSTTPDFKFLISSKLFSLVEFSMRKYWRSEFMKYTYSNKALLSSDFYVGVLHKNSFCLNLFEDHWLGGMDWLHIPQAIFQKQFLWTNLLKMWCIFCVYEVLLPDKSKKSSDIHIILICWRKDFSFGFKIKCKRNLAKHKNRTIKGFWKHRKHDRFWLHIKHSKLARDASQ